MRPPLRFSALFVWRWGHWPGKPWPLDKACHNCGDVRCLTCAREIGVPSSHRHFCDACVGMSNGLQPGPRQISFNGPADELAVSAGWHDSGPWRWRIKDNDPTYFGWGIAGAFERASEPDRAAADDAAWSSIATLHTLYEGPGVTVET